MPSLNRFEGCGHLGRDPEVRYAASGNAVGSFSVACSTYGGKDKPEHVYWANVKCFGKTAEIIKESCKKGSPVYVEGRLEEESWDDKATGQKRTKTVIIANHVWPLARAQGSQVDTGAAGKAAAAATQADLPTDFDPSVGF